jgi:hypothetical protein
MATQNREKTPPKVILNFQLHYQKNKNKQKQKL